MFLETRWRFVRQELNIDLRADILPGASSGPAFAGSEVAAVCPFNTVLSTSTIGVVNGTTAVSPEGVVVAVVGSSLAGGDGLALVPLAGNSKGAHYGGASQKQFGEGHHDEGYVKQFVGAESWRRRRKLDGERMALD